MARAQKSAAAAELAAAQIVVQAPAYVADAAALVLAYNAKPEVVTLIRGPEDAVEALKSFKLASAKREHFMVLLLNARHEVTRVEVVSVGSLNASIVHPREVFLPAVLHSAASIVLAHNHPSGDPEPSEEDLTITRRLCEAGELLGIGVLDHVIIARRGVVSFKSRQIL